ncbi:hypothetical protein DEA8626_00564 [Defluviimonas aquaemixtae]|uniref:DUF1194 domain-containing protein n=1 Tax=Albidovulum aquaemixtae TaxID=1542388 RepID=A0A2R8B3F1_9RHOB|nr:DUF1194 domain-containing protein [Defluviimonas aquaemixtae]SPH17050.1 hypothetical protein DEA8626_00564 [Defluviimonas aquaemixtae]
MNAAYAALASLLWAEIAHADCRQALAIGLDVSASVDEQEYALQMQGVARALADPKVTSALLDQPLKPVWLAAYTWSGAESQRLILDWTAMTDADAILRAATAIGTAPRPALSPSTGVGTALLYGHALLDRGPDCWRYTLDLTGDGKNNSGPQPRQLALAPLGAALTVNALVIGSDEEEGWDGGDPGIAELTAWFWVEVVRGPDGFVEAALGFEDFEAAMTRKLLKELSGFAVGTAPPPRPEPVERGRGGAPEPLPEDG